MASGSVEGVLLDSIFANDCFASSIRLDCSCRLSSTCAASSECGATSCHTRAAFSASVGSDPLIAISVARLASLGSLVPRAIENIVAYAANASPRCRAISAER